MDSLTNGQLTRKEKRNFITSLIKSQIQEKVNYILYLTRIKEWKVFDANQVVIPDSKFVQSAIEEAEESYTPVLLQHCYRTFYWGAGFANAQNLKFDPEFLFVASILHDIGLAGKHNHICSTKCFAIYGGDFLNSFAIQNKIPKATAARLNEAVRLHLNPIIDKDKHGNETYLLSKGAAMDVIGANSFKIPKNYINEVHTRYPRNNFKDEIIGTMENFKHLENTRADILYELGFAKMASKNKLDKKNDNET